jgi:tetratricopeptide (TPR) repeat protein
LADQHFAKGVVFFKKNAYKSARQEFLSALRYNPDRAEALDYLKNKMTFKITSLYRIQKGDSLVNIAKNVYHDPNKYYLIAVYNNLAVNQTLIAGKYLKLPALEPGLAMPLVDITGELKYARKLFLNQEYKKVLQSTANILKIDPSNIEAADLKNAALYQIAEGFRQQRNYLESLETLKKLDPRYKGIQEDIAELKVLLKKQAEANYRIGVSYFVNEQFNKAIESWQKTLIQNPRHPKARQDIEKARRLLNKLKEVE